MKKKKQTAKHILLLLTMVLTLSVFAVVPVNAATEAELAPNASYEAYRVDADSMVLDGQLTEGEPWEAVPWTDPFIKQDSDTIDPADAPADAVGKAKFLWSYEGEAGAATSADLYMLLVFQDPDGVWTAHDSESYRSDCFVVSIDETNTYNYSDTAIGKDNGKNSLQHLSGSMFTEDIPMVLEHKDSKWCQYYVSRNGTTVTVEAKIEFRGAAEYAKAEHTIKFAVAIYRTVEEDGNVLFQKNAWGGLWPNTKKTATMPNIILKEELPEGYELPPEPTDPPETEPTEPSATQAPANKPTAPENTQTPSKPAGPADTDKAESGAYWWIIAGVAVVLVAAVVVIVIKKKKK